MPFQIIRNDITKVKADAIVNTANPKPTIGRGTDSAIYAAAGKDRLLAAREEIKDYIIREFGYDLSRTCDEIRPTYHHIETCQQTVPEAITAFLEGTDFEDVIRTAVSLGGDSDTLTCIAGGIAEAFYGVPAIMESECRKRLPDDMVAVIDRFDALRGRDINPHDDFLSGNKIIEEAIDKMYKDPSRENLIAVLESIRKRMHEDGQFMIPVIPPQEMFDLVNPENIKVGDTIQADEEMHFKLQHIHTQDDEEWLAVFTSQEEYEKGESSSIIQNFIDGMLKGCRNMDEPGIIINPWGNNFKLSKEMINMILDADKPDNHIYFDIGDITKLDVDVIHSMLPMSKCKGVIDIRKKIVQI